MNRLKAGHSGCGDVEVVKVTDVDGCFRGHAQFCTNRHVSLQVRFGNAKRFSCEDAVEAAVEPDGS